MSPTIGAVSRPSTFTYRLSGPLIFANLDQLPQSTALPGHYVCHPSSIVAANIGTKAFVARIGAAIAVLLYLLFPEDAVLLSLFGFFFSIPCFWWALAKPRYLSASRFVLLTYNLTCLFWWVPLEFDLAKS
jgi:hypothetical protein